MSSKFFKKFYKTLFLLSVLLTVFFVYPNFSQAATRTISDAGGNWDDTGTWVEGAVPTAADDVVATATSGSVTIVAGDDAFVRSIVLTGYTGTLSHNLATTLFIGDGTAGASNNALIFPTSGWTYTLGSTTTAAIDFVSTSTTQQNVNFGGKSAGSVNFNGVGGSWKLTGAMATGSAATVTLTNGSLDTNGQLLTIGRFNSDNSNTRSLTLGGLSSITLAGTSTAWDIDTTTGLTFDGGNTSITASASGITFGGGGLTYGTVAITGAGTSTINGANTFGTLTRTGTATKTNRLTLGANQVVSSGFNLNGNSATNRLLVKSNTLGTPRTITNNALITSITNADFQDITGAGTASWDISAATGNSGDAGGNSSITFTTAATQTWNGTSGGNWSANAWTSRVPLPQDDVVINAAFSASQTVTADMPRLGKSISFADATGTPTFDISSISNTIYGSLTLISGMNLTVSTTLVFEGRSSFTLTSATKAFDGINVQMYGGTLTLQDNLTLGSSDILSFQNGTFDANGKDLSIGLFTSDNSNTRTITMGAGTWTLTGNNTNIWDFTATTGLTFNRGNAIIVNYSGATGTRSIEPGFLAEASAPSFNITAGTDTVLVYGAFLNLDFTGFSGTLADWPRTIYGNLIIASGMTITATSQVTTFAATSGTKTITSNGVTLDFPITFDGVGGTFQLADHLTVGATRTVTLTNGTFDANNKNFSMGKFSSSNSNTRVITMGSGTWTLSGTGTVWTTATITGLTLGQDTSTIKITDTSTTANTFSGGGETFNNIWWSRGASTASNTIAESNTFTDFKDDGSAAHSILFTAATTTTVTTFTVSGTAGNLITINSTNTATHALTKSGGGTISSDYLNIQHSVATPSTTWYAGANSTDNQATTTAGSGWIFTAPPVTCTSLDTGNWNTAGTWDCAKVPAVGDTVIVALSHTVTMDVDSAVLVTITVNGTLNTSNGTSRALSGTTLTIGSSGTVTANASTITLSGTTGTLFTITSGGVFTFGTSTVVFSGNGDATLHSAAIAIAFNAMTSSGTGTKTLGAGIITNGALTISDGTLQLSSFDVTANSTTSITGTLNDDSATGTNLFVGAVTINSGGVWTTSNNPAFTFRGGLTNDSSSGFTSGSGIYTFNTNAQTVSGTQSFTITNLTNSVTSSTGLSFSGAQPTVTTLTQGSSAQLTFSGSMPTITTLTATASGNTVSYTSTAGAQTVISTTYVNVTIDKSGQTATLGGNIILNDTLTITAGALDVGSNYSINLKSWTDTGSGTFTEGGGTVTFDVASGTINSNETFENVTINHAGTTTLGAALDLDDTLTITAGALDVSGTNYGISLKSWTDSGSGTFTEGTGTVTFDVASGTINSNETFENVTINHAGTTTLGAALDLDDTLTITAGALDVSGTNYGISLKSWTDSGSGTFTESGGTVTFDVASGTINSNETFENVTINHAGTTTLGAALDLDDTLTITAGALDVSGTNYGISLKSWTDSGSGTFTEGTGTVTFDVAGGTINSNETFENVTINHAGTTTLAAALDLDDTLTITAGALDVGSDYGITLKSWTDSGSGTFTEGSGTVTFDITGGTINSNETFENVTINHAGTTTLGAALDLDDTLTITAGALDVSGTNYGISLKSWTDSGSGTFTESGGTVTFDVASGTINSNETFENVTINHAGTTTLGAALDLDDTLTITAGALDVSGTNYGISLKSWTDSGSGTFTEGTGTVTFDVAGGTINSNEAFNSITINHAGTSTLSADTTVAGTLTITSGTLDASSYTITLSGTSTVFSNSGSFTAGTSTILITDTSSTSKTFAGGGGTYNTVTITGSGSGAVIISGSNTFSTFTIGAPKTVTFTSSTTQTISGSFSCTGTSGNVITINSSGGVAASLSKSSGTVSCDYLHLTNSAATGGASWQPGLNSTDNGGNSGWLFNSAPSISSGPSDGGSSLTSPNSIGSVLHFSTIATDSNSNSYYLAICKTNSITGGSNSAPTCGGGAWCTSVATASGFTASCSYNIQSQSVSSGNNDWYAFVCDNHSSSLCSSAAQGSGDTGSPFYVTAASDSSSSGGGQYYETEQPAYWNTPSSNPSPPTPSYPNPDPPAPSTPTPTPTPSTPPYIPPYTPPPYSPPSTPLTPGSQSIQALIQKILVQIEALKKQIAFLQTPVPSTPGSGSGGGGGGGSSSGYLVYDIKFFADRVWQFANSIKSFGTNLKSQSVINKVFAKKWSLPGFNYSALSNLTKKELPATKAIQPTPLSSLDVSAKAKIPTDIVFPKLAGGVVDLPIFLSFDKKGIGTQKINTIPGGPLSLLIKPSEAPRSIKGLITLKKTNFSSIKTFVAVQNPNLIEQGTASLQDADQEPEMMPYVSNATFVVLQFEYFKVEDGIYQANILSPAVEGEYEIITTIEYKNAAIPTTQAKLVMIIDPEGYVYRQLKDGRLRIQGATVSIYQQDPITKVYKLWDASKFNQKNPITTNETGKYGFLVPPGMYYLKAEAKDYQVWQSVKFEVRLNNSIHIDIPLKKKTLWQRLFGP